MKNPTERLNEAGEVPKAQPQKAVALDSGGALRDSGLIPSRCCCVFGAKRMNGMFVGDDYLEAVRIQAVKEALHRAADVMPIDTLLGADKASV